MRRRPVRRPGCLVRPRSCRCWRSDSFYSGELTLELAPRVPLAVEQRGEVAVIDARVRGSRDLRLGVIGNAKAGGFDHSQVIRAVADRKGVGGREAKALAQFD